MSRTKTLKKQETKVGNEASEAELVGKVVFSLSSGVGRITSISQMDISDSDFYVVHFDESTAVDYIRTDGDHNFRVISSKKEFQSALKELKSKNKVTKFESRKERMQHLKDLEKSYDLDSLIKLIKLGSGIDDLGQLEKKILQRAIDTLVDEHMVHTGRADEESREEIELLISA